MPHGGLNQHAGRGGAARPQARRRIGQPPRPRALRTPLLRPRPEPTHSAHCGLSSALPGEARARARPAALARLLTPVAMARMHPQAQNEAQRLTQALHDEKRRADAAEARADKLVSGP